MTFYGRDYDDDGSPIEPPGPRVVRLSDVTPERVTWLWQDYLPLGKLVVLDGDPGLGKSMLSIDFGARISTGSPMPDGTAPVKGAVLILSAEDGLADTIRPRIDAAGGDPDQIITITDITYETPDGPASRPVRIPDDLAAITRVIFEHNVVLVVVDVLMAYLNGDVNSHRDQDVRRALHPVAMMAERLGCCVIVLRHLNKAPGLNAVYRGGGSIGIVGAARAGFMVGLDPSDETGQRRVLAPVKCNLGPEPPALAYRLVPDELHGCARVVWDGISEHKASGLLAEPGDPQERTERDEAAGWLTSYLMDNGGEDRAGDIIKAAARDGINSRTLQRARERAGVTTAKASFGGGWVWKLATARGPRRHEGDVGASSQGLSSTSPSVSPSPHGHGTGRKPDLATHARVLDEHAKDPGASYAELAERAGTNKSTAYRVINEGKRHEPAR